MLYLRKLTDASEALFPREQCNRSKFDWQLNYLCGPWKTFLIPGQASSIDGSLLII